MTDSIPTLSAAGRYLMLVVAFLGWLFCGFHMQITQLTGQAAAIDLLAQTGQIDAARYHAFNKRDQQQKKAKTVASALSADDAGRLTEWRGEIGRWFAWFQCAFLFGAASGGLVFGRLGDRIGRSRAMAASILTYSLMAAAASFAQSPVQLWMLWFLACMGVGGTWPNGVALVSEAWTGASRLVIAGAIGTAANIGIFLFATLASQPDYLITPDHWRWAFQVGAAPAVLGIVALLAVPESPRWLAARHAPVTTATDPARSGVFRRPLLGVTLVAILLATIPMIGGWGTANWMNPWADAAGAGLDPPDYGLKARMNQARAITGIVGSLLGGWMASTFGRRRTYFAVSLLSLGLAQYIFWFLVPTSDTFLLWVALLGFVSGVYFGWLPLCLPELFPTRVRSTGAGVGFNFGRIVTALTIFATGALKDVFGGDYATIGRLTSLLFLLGMIFIWFAPDTSDKQLED